jgi:hypothetical protein
MHARRNEWPFSCDERLGILSIAHGIGAASRRSCVHRVRPWHRDRLAYRRVFGGWQYLWRSSLNPAFGQLVFRRHRESGVVLSLSPSRDAFQLKQGRLRRRWRDESMFA